MRYSRVSNDSFASSPPPMPLLAGSLVLALTSTVLSAWILKMDSHTVIYANLLQMKANAAFSLALLAFALLCLNRGLPLQKGLPSIFLITGLVGALGAITLFEYTLHWDAGIDTFFSNDIRADSFPGRMSPLTAAILVLLAVAMACANSLENGRIILSQILSVLVATLGFITLLGYLYRAPGLLLLSRNVPMSASTAGTVLLLALGLLVAHPQVGLPTPLYSRTVAAKMGKRLLVSVAIVLPLLAWLRLEGQASHLYSPEFGGGLVLTVALLMMAALIVFHTSVTNRAETRIKYLNRVYSVLSEVNALIVRVADQTELFNEASRIAVQRGGFPRAWFGLVDPARATIELVAGLDPALIGSPMLADRLSLRRAGAGSSPIARAVHGGVLVVSNDVAQDLSDPFRNELLMQGIRSYAVFPLYLQKKVIGVFKLHAEEANFFHAEELRLLNELVGDIVFGINHLAQRSKLDHLAYFDSLTNLANARLFEDRLQQAVDHASRNDGGLAIFVFDIVAFKLVNDSFGRPAGDETLRALAERLIHACGETNCGRLGSNLFALIVVGYADETEIAGELRRILDDCFAKDFEIFGNTFPVAARFGIAIYKHDGDDGKTLVSNAETALKAARKTGQRYRFYNQLSNDRIAERIKVHRLLSRALERSEFTLHYQGKVDGKSLALCGAEALLRWNSADLGAVSPAEFVPLLEDLGLIEKVGAWAVSQAASDSDLHIRPTHPGFRIAVNVSASQLQQPDFVERIHAAFGEHVGLAELDIELTESLLMTDVAGSIDKLRRLRALGLKVALDDFGTGYSSMAYLAKLPLDYLKIDQSFIAGLPADPECVTLVSSMIGLGHALGLEVIAEGVETAAQAALLSSLGCDQLQGYHFARPEPLAALLARLHAPGPAPA